MTTKREQFLVHCMQYHGTPYIWGGSDLTGIDCSGLNQKLMDFFKLDPPGDQTADGLKDHYLKNGTPIPVEQADIGCVAFYGSPSKAIHIATCIGDGLMIEAGGGGSKTTSVAIAMKQGAKVRIRAIKYRADFLFVIKPNGLSW